MRLKKVFIFIAPSLVIIFLSLFQLFFNSKITSEIIFVYIITLMYVMQLYYPKHLFMWVVFLSTIVLDSINNVTLGSTSLLIFLCYILIYVENRFLRVADFFKYYAFFIVNIIISLFLLWLINFGITLDYMSFPTFLFISVILFPIVVFSNQLLVRFMVNDKK